MSFFSLLRPAAAPSCCPCYSVMLSLLLPHPCCERLFIGLYFFALYGAYTFPPNHLPLCISVWFWRGCLLSKHFQNWGYSYTTLMLSPSNTRLRNSSNRSLRGQRVKCTNIRWCCRPRSLGFSREITSTPWMFSSPNACLNIDSISSLHGTINDLGTHKLGCPSASVSRSILPSPIS